MLCYYREKKIICGNYMDVQIYPVYRKAGERRAKAKPTSEVQQKLNDINAARKLTRLAHANFTDSDLALHLTYAPDSLPADVEDAKRDGQNFLRRLRRLYKRHNTVLKYIWVCEKGKKSDRVHHHLILSGGVSRDEIEALWQKGFANTRRLRFDANGIAGLSHYITKQPLFFKHWNASRNLVQPVEVVDDYKYSAKKVREMIALDMTPFGVEKYYPGWQCASCQGQANDVNGGCYVFLQMYAASKTDDGGKI